MKRKVTLVFIIALVAGGMVGFAGDGNGASGNRCDPAGTWYAELPSPPYMATITPIQGHSRYSVIYKGVYNAWDLPTSTFTLEDPVFFEAMTNWSGELVKSGAGYDVAVIAILGGGEGMPHWFPLETWGVKGYIEFSEDCNTMFGTWPGGIHAWVWDITSETPPIPWVTSVDYHPIHGEVTILETYHRMIMPTD
jgi:hypothetical protein